MNFTHQIRSTASRATKVMLRLDRHISRRGLRSYRGYSQHGKRYARLQFDNQTIEIDSFGLLHRMLTTPQTCERCGKEYCNCVIG